MIISNAEKGNVKTRSGQGEKRKSEIDYYYHSHHLKGKRSCADELSAKGIDMINISFLFSRLPRLMPVIAETRVSVFFF